MMTRDIRSSALYRESDALYRDVRQPRTGQISDALEISVAADGRTAVFAGVVVDTLDGAPPTRVCAVDLETGDVRHLTFGPNSDRLPKFSPDGQNVAFLSDRDRPGDFQLWLLDPRSGAARPAPMVDGWIEYLHWSPDGRQVVLGVAGHGADISGGQGAVASKRADDIAATWLPNVETGDEEYRWRTAWLYDLATDTVRQVGPSGINFWEIAWCGTAALIAVVSPGPGEGLWYSATLVKLDLASGRSTTLFSPERQIGLPAASPSGRHVAIVEAVCSDRWLVAGELVLLDLETGSQTRVATSQVDIGSTEWRSDDMLLLGGHRSFETVVGTYEVGAGRFAEHWVSDEISTAGRYVMLSGFGEGSDFALVGEGFRRAPEIAIVRQGQYRCITSFDLGYARHAGTIRSVDQILWTAPDGERIEGWLLLPEGEGPHPLVMDVHGGPVWQWRQRWLGRQATYVLMLIKRGIAVFLPNPRGSTGRGQAFAGHVQGDMGGADTYDCLSGLDALVARGIADPQRLGVMGISYGGYMTSWLITQDSRFAAAIPVAPVTNFVSEHLVSNIPHWVSLFLNDTYSNPSGRYFERSPIMHAHKVRTPTLNICGALDRCTPPGEAVQFHEALLENGVKSVLVTYPEEGHAIRGLPAYLDYAARVIDWFEQHLLDTPALDG